MGTIKSCTVLVVLLVLAVSCSNLDLGLDSDEPEWGDSYVKGQTSRARQRTVRLAKVLAAWEAEGGLEPADYLLGPGDELEIGVFALERPNETVRLNSTVAQDGSVTLPWVGMVPVGGLTVCESEQLIRAAYAGRYLADPQVTVNVAEYRSAPVVVTGAVIHPGVFYLDHGSSSVIEMLARAGGLASEAGEDLLIVRGRNGPHPGATPESKGAGPSSGTTVQPGAAGTETIAIDLEQLVDQGNLLLNLPIRGGDVITVAPRAAQYIYVLGYVRQPGAYKLEEDRPVDAVRAAAMAGGFMAIGRAKNSFLIRDAGGGQKAIPVDLRKLAQGDLPPLYMEPGDTLVVSTSTMGRFCEFLAPSMGASISATASVAP